MPIFFSDLYEFFFFSLFALQKLLVTDKTCLFDSFARKQSHITAATEHYVHLYNVGVAFVSNVTA